MTSPPHNECPQLRRTLGFWALTVYGVGDMLGAGIYALVGEVAGKAGRFGWISFGIAMAVAAVTALSYSEFVARYPRSGGESYFCQQAYRRRWFALLIGWLVFCSGLVSLSAVTHGFTDYLQGLHPDMSRWAAYLGFLGILTAINFWGMRQSSATNIICTMIEASGLLLVLIVGLIFLSSQAGNESASQAAATASTTGAGASIWSVGLLTGATLAFFAFIGFEDMVNIAEEVRRPARHFPAAILTALAVTAIVYMAVTWVAVRVVPPPQLAEAKGPLLSVVRTASPRVPEWLFTLITLFAVANTGLLNFIMASRLVYGMADQGIVPRWLHVVHRSRRTPHRAILLCLLVAVVLTFSGTLRYLAGTTSVLLLLVFMAVNIGLLVIKVRERNRRDDADSARRPANGARFDVPWPMPLLGTIVCAGLLIFAEWPAMIGAAVLMTIGFGLVIAHRAHAASSR